MILPKLPASSSQSIKCRIRTVIGVRWFQTARSGRDETTAFNSNRDNKLSWTLFDGLRCRCIGCCSPHIWQCRIGLRIWNVRVDCGLPRQLRSNWLLGSRIVFTAHVAAAGPLYWDVMFLWTWKLLRLKTSCTSCCLSINWTVRCLVWAAERSLTHFWQICPWFSLKSSWCFRFRWASCDLGLR